MSEFTPEQLATARAAAWHQNGEALLTLDALRDWLNGYGLVLFTPRPLQISSPSPSFVEAVLGAANTAPTPAEMEQARALLARMVAEGSAIPLNLLGGVSDVPDFVVSSKLFSFMFTLRGDKAWKQAPVTTGTTRVAPLSVNAYQALVEKGESTLAELVHELGREVTEAAVLRSMCELWGHLRVLPVPQVDSVDTKWELATSRFTKQIKAGMNAGLPSALSGLISVYLAQAIAASEEEVEVFLSPLIARSRIREVLHALLSARQLETVVLEGKTLLHIEGELPEFAPLPVTEVVVGDVSADGVPATDGASAPASYAPREDGSRIRKFAGARPERERRPFNRENKFGGAPKRDFTKPWEEDKGSTPALDAGSTGEAPKFFKRPEGGWKPARSVSDQQPQYGEAPTAGSEEKPRFERREGGDRPARKPYGDRPSRPFGDRPKFDGPRKSFGGGDRPRPSFGGKPGFGGGDRPRRSFGDKPGFGGGEGRPPRKDFGDRPSRPFGDRPKFDGPRKSFGGGDRPRPSFGGKPGFGGGDRPRRPFGDKPGFGGGEGRPPRRDFGDKPFRPRPSGDGEGRPPRRDFGDRPSRPFGDRPKFDGPRKSFGGGDRPRPSFGGKPGFGGGDRPRPSFGGKPGFGGGDRPRPSFGGKPGFGGGDRPRRPFGDKPGFGGGEGRPPRRDFGDKPFRPRPSGDGEGGPPRRDFGDRPARPFGDRPKFDGPRKSFGGGDRPRPSFGGKPGGFGGKPSFGGKPGGGFGGKKFGGKPGGGFGGKKFGGKPGGGFGGKKFGGKPFGSRPPRKEGEGGGQG